MALNSEQKHLIVTINAQVNNLLAEGASDKMLLFLMRDELPAIKQMIMCASVKEIDMYFEEYAGFYYYIKLLEKVAQDVDNGLT